MRERAAAGIDQYVILGAGLDTFAQRHPDVSSSLQIYEVDQPGTQAWKRRRLAEEGYPVPEGLHFVSVDFEIGESWWDALNANGFNADGASIVSSMGVSMYLTTEATDATLRQVAALAPGSVLTMTFMLPLDLLDDVEGPMLAGVEAQARASGTPFISHYSPDEMVERASPRASRPLGWSGRTSCSSATSKDAPMGCGRPAPSRWWWRKSDPDWRSS